MKRQFSLKKIGCIFILSTIILAGTQSCAAAKAKKCNCPTFGTNKRH